MEVRLLGPLDVVVGGVATAIPGAGERALLALLALNAGRVVSNDRLINALWGERLPANPHNALQTRVSKLRRVVTAAGADATAILTTASGYQLAIDPSCVDASRFATTVAQARAAADAGDSDRAARLFTAALAAWRGAALLDFADEAWATAEARRLDDLRLAARCERIDLELRAGRHADVLAELEALVSDHPLYERAYAQLMLALYRCGRQADALAAYQRARETLDAELGLDPSGELRDVETAILRQDASLAAPAREALRTAADGNLPARVASIVGRGDDLDDLIGVMEAERLVTVTGPGGVGKTTLAIEAGRRLGERIDDPVWFVDLTAATAGVHVAGVIAQTLSLPAPDAADDRGASLARQLRSHRGLIILDNCEHVIDAAAVMVERILTSCAQVRVLATSREALAVSGEVQYALSPLSMGDAVHLFVQRARAASRTFALDAENSPHVHRLCIDLDGMPLAIELAAARVKTLPPEAIAERLADRFSLLTGGPRTARARHQTLRATVDWSYQLLTQDERLLLRRLSVFVGNWSIPAAEEVCATGELTGEAVLDLVARLVDRSLVIADDGAFRLLETIRQFAAERLDESGEAHLVTGRNATRLLRLAEDCERELRGGDERPALERLAREQDSLRATLAWAADHDVQTGQRLAGALSWFWQLTDHAEGRRFVQRLLAADDAPTAARARALQAWAVIGRPSAVVLHPDESCAAAARESIALLEQAGDGHGAAFSKALAAIEGVAGRDVDDCHRLLDEAGAASSGSPWLAAFVDYVRMKIVFRWGDPDTAMLLGDGAADRFSRLGSAWGVGSVRAHQGYDLRLLGRLHDALVADERALTTYRDAGLLNNTQMLYGDTGITRVMLGDEDGARADFAAAVEICRRYGYLAGAGMAETGYGYLARLRGDDVEAREHLTRAVDVLGDVGFLTLLAAAQSALGHCLAVLGEEAGAETAHRDVLRIAASVHESWVLALGLEGLAGVSLLRGQLDRAAELLGAAEELRNTTSRPVDPITRRDVERIDDAVRSGLGDERYVQAFARGRGDAADPGVLVTAL